MTTISRSAFEALRSECASMTDTLKEFEGLLDGSDDLSNKEYLLRTEFLVVVRAMAAQLTSTLYASNTAAASDRIKGIYDADASLLPPAKRTRLEAWSQEDREAAGRRLARLRELEAAIYQERALRLDTCSKPKPRLPYISNLYELSEDESRLLETMAVLAAAQTDILRIAVSEEDSTRRSHQLCRLAGVSEIDFEEFVDAEREHVKENLLIITEDEFGQTTLTAAKLNKIAIKLIRGNTLTPDEVLKASGTKLESVLAAEGLSQDILSNKLPTTPDPAQDCCEDDDGIEDSRVQDNSDICEIAKEPSPTSVLDKLEQLKDDSSTSLPSSPAEKELEYLGGVFEVIALQIRLATAKMKAQVKEQSGSQSSGGRMLFSGIGNDEGGGNSRAMARELEAKLRVAEAKLTSATQHRKTHQPRLIAMAAKLGLDDYEIRVVALLVGRVLSPVIKALMDSWESGGSGLQRIDDTTTVGACLAIFSPHSFAEQVLKRSKFYKTSKLVSKGVLRIHTPRWHSQGSNDLTESRLELDRRILDWCVGLDSEISEIFESSELVAPKAKFSDLVLPESLKEQLVTMCEAYCKLPARKDAMLLDEASYGGTGLVVLLCGPSGVGKTLTVHCMAEKLNKRVLQVDFAGLRGKASGNEDIDADLRGLFREAEMADAVCFFDECESLFRSRDQGGGDRLLRALLQEIEKSRGIVFLATNRAYEIDSAMHRRINLVIEYKKPGPIERKAIWKSLIDRTNVSVAEAIDWDSLALKELTGGLIKNALVSAVLLAIHRTDDVNTNPIITEEDLLRGCALQQRGVMYKQGNSLGHRESISNLTIDTLALSEPVSRELKRILAFEKQRGQVFGAWNFAGVDQNDLANCILFYGPRGGGKRTIASALAATLGSTLYKARTSDIISTGFHSGGDEVSKQKRLDTILDDARLSDSVLLFDDFDAALISPTATVSSGSLSGELASLLKKLKSFPGVIFLIAHIDEVSNLNFDPDLLRQISSAIPISMPSPALRAAIFRAVIPASAPLDPSIDFTRLGHSFELLPTSIRRAATNAAVSAANRGTNASITYKDLINAAKHEYQRLRGTHQDAIDRLFT